MVWHEEKWLNFAVEISEDLNQIFKSGGRQGMMTAMIGTTIAIQDDTKMHKRDVGAILYKANNSSFFM